MRIFLLTNDQDILNNNALYLPCGPWLAQWLSASFEATNIYVYGRKREQCSCKIPQKSHIICVGSKGNFIGVTLLVTE